MRMVDVTGKDRTVRVATADGYVQTTTAVVDLITGNDTPKGDVLAAARLAAIMAVKRTPDLIPLCHPISIGGVDVDITASASARLWFFLCGRGEGSANRRLCRRPDGH